MENIHSFFQLMYETNGSPKLHEQQKWNFSAAEDHKWSMAASKLAFEERMQVKVEQGIDNPIDMRLRRHANEIIRSKGGKGKLKNKGGEGGRTEVGGKLSNADWRIDGLAEKHALMGSLLNAHGQSHATHNLDKRFKCLPQAEMLPRNETLGGFIFVCNNETMQENLKRQLFGMPQRYRDSVRAIQPGLPLFLYNYTVHQLHGIFEAASFGGSNIDPSAWEDKKCKGESKFPAQVRSRIRRICKPLEEDSFRPILHHYDGPKFRLQLNVPETLALLDLFNNNASS